ncbi:MAG TPA: N-acetylneuraminate synthase [Lentisphaeria bacterium]|nr:MAG: N-acetylneuraminate synthase [Lentisphaerae bacterium GWF2_38_69]HBM15417.1 N-acetylneuraminate synthase [Lentisphaeria bacterium]
MLNHVFIIAEAGVNHNGSLELAKKLIDAAVEAGCDAVKFQTFKTENVISENAQKAEYQKQTTGGHETQFEMVKKLELSYAQFSDLNQHCQTKGIMFLSTPFDLESVDFLAGMNLPIIKIPSGEITHLPYLRKIGGLRKRIIMSTGMADLKEIKTAVSVLLKSGTQRKDITILHCNTEYPTPFNDVNLRAMATIQKALSVKVGYSDHTLGIEAAVAAAALGASVIEKHFTLDRNMPGPDHKASLDPNELKAMVAAIRNIEKALGSDVKQASASEKKNISIARKSIVAACEIKRGEVLTKDNLTCKRPGDGISPMKWDQILGTKAKRNYTKDEMI